MSNSEDSTKRKTTAASVVGMMAGFKSAGSSAKPTGGGGGGGGIMAGIAAAAAAAASSSSVTSQATPPATPSARTNTVRENEGYMRQETRQSNQTVGKSRVLCGDTTTDISLKPHPSKLLLLLLLLLFKFGFKIYEDSKFSIFYACILKFHWKNLFVSHALLNMLIESAKHCKFCKSLQMRLNT